jgi:copper transport protein
MGRWRRVLIAAAVAGVAVGWLAAQPAAAHAVVVATNPAADAVLPRPPPELRVVFSEPVRPLGEGLSLRGGRGRVRLGPVGHPPDRPEVLAAAVPHLGDGAYTAVWRIVSVDDGHVEAGSFAFTVGAGSSLRVSSPGPRQLPPPGQAAARWVAVTGVLILAGLVLTGLALWRRAGRIGPGEPAYARLALAAAGVAAVGLVGELAVDAGTATGGGVLGGLAPAAIGLFVAASPATAARIGVPLALVVAVALLVRHEVRGGRRPGPATLALAVGAVAALTLGAHATGLRPRWWFLALETTHLLAVAAWVGGLVALVSLGRRATTATVRRFSALALRAVAVIAVSGALEALGEVPGRAGLLHTDYGRTVLVKLGTATGVVLLAAVARFRLLPRAHDEHPPRPLRRLVTLEAAGALAVVLVAAVLANTVPAGEVIEARAAGRAAGGPQQQRLAAGPLHLQLSLEPGTVGLNTLSLQVTDPAGRPLDNLRAVRVTVADQVGRVAPTPLTAPRVATALYRVATDVFTVPGRWQVMVALPAAGPPLQASVGIAAVPATVGATPPDPPDALVLGGRAGSALVGLTAFAAGSGLVVRVRGGLGIPPPAAPRPLWILGPSGRPVGASVQPCGAGCAEAFLPAPPRGPLTAVATLPAGTARFQVPVPLPPSGVGRLHAADRALAGSGSYRIHEVLDSGLGAVVRTDYLLEAPDRARWHTDSGTSTLDTVWVGEARYTRDGEGPWKKETTPGLTLKFPARNWSDQKANVVDLGAARIGGTPVTVLAFLDRASGAYHRLWVDPANRILREQMHAPGHFMTREYAGYGALVAIRPPPPP